MTEINKHFLALGLDPSATQAQVKEARLWYTKAFHPDRFPKNSTDQKKAEEKQKEINLAFEQITDWFAKDGKPAAQHKHPPTQAKRAVTFIEQLDEYVSFYGQLRKSLPHHRKHLLRPSIIRTVVRAAFRRQTSGR